MSLESMRVYVESTFQSAMRGSFSGVPIRFENASFLQPEGTWTDICVVEGKSFNCNVGTTKVVRHVGIIQIDVMAPERAGLGQANQVAEFAGNTFSNTNSSLSDGARAVFFAPSYHQMGRQGGFYRLMVRVPFWRDEAPR